MKLFAIGVGGSGAKCLEAVIHLHTMGLFDQKELSPKLGVLFVEPDHQSALLERARTALSHTKSLREVLEVMDRSSFCQGGTSKLKDYGIWNPVESMASQETLNMAQVYTKTTLQDNSPALGKLMDCLFTQEEQEQDLSVGFRGRPPIGSTLMTSMPLKDHRKTWGDLLMDVRQAASMGEKVFIHMFGSVFGGTGASGVPALGRSLRNWLNHKSIQEEVTLSASLLVPYFDFSGHGTEDTGLHAKSRNFQHNTIAALRYLSQSGAEDFDQVYLLGSSMKVAYDFSVGGTSQKNAAHLVELVAALGLEDSITRRKEPGVAAYTLTGQRKPTCVTWDDLPGGGSTQKVLSQGFKLAVVWRNNISLDLRDADVQSPKRFYVGAPWATHFYDSRSLEDQKSRRVADEWSESLMTWLKQLCSNTGEFEQRLLDHTKLKALETHIESFDALVHDNDSTLTRQWKRKHSVQYLKDQLDKACSQKPPADKGTASLLDTLWNYFRNES